MTTPTSSASTSSPAQLSAAVIAAWQDALAAEHAAIFGYGALGPHLSAPDQVLARADESAHHLTRDATAASIASTGTTAVSSLDDYPLPFALTSPLTAQRLALRLEDACAQAWRYLVATAAQTGSTTGPASSAGLPTAFGLRATGLTALTASSVRALHWRTRVTPATPFEAFPGITG